MIPLTGRFSWKPLRARAMALMIVFLVVASTSILLANQGGRLRNDVGPSVHLNGQVAHSSISITGDSGFTAANGVTGGSGTTSDPYVISGWSITPTFDFLTISNTRAFFVVRNVTLSGSANGIVFTNVTNGRLENSQSYQYDASAIRVVSSRNIVLAGDTGSAGGCGPNEGCGGDGIWVDSSSNILVTGNYLPGTQGNDLSISGSNNVTIIGNSIVSATYDGLVVGRSSNITISKNSFSHSGLTIDGLVPGASYKITPDNLVNGKPLYFYNGCSNGLTLDHIAVGQLIISNCSDVRLSNLSVTGTEVGITMQNVQRALIENVNASADKIAGLQVTASSGITVENGDFSWTPFSFGFLYPLQWGINIRQSNATTVSGNRFYSDSMAVEMSGSANATVNGNTFSSDYTNVCLSGSTDIHVYHNNFFPQQGYYCTSDNQPGHFWDNGYPSGGNYWSSYTGVDKCSGPMQNVCTGGDGIGDTPYNVTGGVYQDHYPLMKPFVASSNPTLNLNSTLRFDGITVSLTGSLSLSSGSLSGQVTVTATNSTTGAVLFSKTYIITNLQVTNGLARFLLNVAVSPYPLSAELAVYQNANVLSATVGLTRQLDIASDGVVDISDLASIALRFQCSMGSACYDPRTDVLAQGIVGIVDLAMAAWFFQAPDFS